MRCCGHAHIPSALRGPGSSRWRWPKRQSHRGIRSLQAQSLRRRRPAANPHALRHTCASWMLVAGVPIAVVSRHLGHENIATTVDIYGSVDRSSFKAAADVMGKLLT
ncbi:hypothetical protein BST15_16590 [Mycolicibacter arupensis]|uniref:Tyr recombinase domain-containing protein n=1 Tax=Mycolicibacter arupensis TaxID=342002 RepID=A0ABX3RKP6_9MYCO|nr:hypothetical protein BST15_16590 [Mycolicibacter arupensis]